jgi:hypothetical protein
MIRHVSLGFMRVIALCLIGIFAAYASAQENSSTPTPATVVREPTSLDSDSLAMTANIPFEFWIGPEKMAPGQYALEVLVPSVALIRSADGKVQQELFMIDIGPGVAERDSRLVFETRNGRSVLTEVWCTQARRRLTAQSATDPGNGNLTKLVELSYR